MSKSITRASVAILLGLIAVLTGCNSETKISVVPVSGKVTFQGQPASGAQVVLHPVGAKEDKKFAATGKVKDDGTFKIGVYADDDGAPPGEYVATVQWFKVVQTDGGVGRGPNVLPAKYAKADTSPLKVTVKNEATQLDPIDVN
jgi:hypothetical protein